MIFAANLKCNHTRESFAEYAKFLNENLTSKDVLVFPPATAFLKGEARFTQGAQNFYPCINGSFTGEIGKEMLDEFNINLVMIGHSERRALGEDEALLKKKFDFAKANNYKIIYCIGESADVYKNKTTKDFLSYQLDSIDLDYEHLMIAYEPIWAIGTGSIAPSEVISEILDFLTQKTKAALLYGGSVNQKSIAEISMIPSCSGALIGTASWDAKNFLDLIRSV